MFRTLICIFGWIFTPSSPKTTFLQTFQLSNQIDSVFTVLNRKKNIQKHKKITSHLKELLCCAAISIAAIIMVPLMEKKQKKPDAKHSTLHEKKHKGNRFKYKIAQKKSYRKVEDDESTLLLAQKIFLLLLWPKTWNTSFSGAAMEKSRKRINANILKSIFPLGCSYALRKMVFVLSCFVFLVWKRESAAMQMKEEPISAKAEW